MAKTEPKTSRMSKNSPPAKKAATTAKKLTKHPRAAATKPVKIGRGKAPAITRGRTMQAILIERQRKIALPEVYLWQGQTHKSLSSIARAIIGTRWSGPRFFGL